MMSANKECILWKLHSFCNHKHNILSEWTYILGFLFSALIKVSTRLFVISVDLAKLSKAEVIGSAEGVEVVCTSEENNSGC